MDDYLKWVYKKDIIGLYGNQVNNYKNATNTLL